LIEKIILITEIFFSGPAVVERRLRVLNINMWGFKFPLGMDQMPRFRALRDHLSRNYYDVVLLQEVWQKDLHDIIAKSMPYVSPFKAYNGCKGNFIVPIECSGLVVLSRHPIERVFYNEYSRRGELRELLDGSMFVRKGLAGARIRWKGLTLDVFTTHLVTYLMDPDSNDSVRRLQSAETVDIIRKSNADIKIFSGDANAFPDTKHPRTPYRILTSFMKDAQTDKFPGSSRAPVFHTYGNHRNTYTRHAMLPGRIDYIMYAARPGLQMFTDKFRLPPLTAYANGRRVSIADHEPLLAEFVVRERVVPVINSNYGKR
jgi:endonuclease/exonuclease/phosphatase family metal-dependent hydrolase